MALEGRFRNISPVPSEVEKPLDFSTSSGPPIKAWAVERTPHAFIFANPRPRNLEKMNTCKIHIGILRPMEFLFYAYLPEHYKNPTGSMRKV